MATDNFDSNELFNIYLQKMGSIPLLSREDEIEVARRIAEQGNDAEIAKQTLITANLYNKDQSSFSPFLVTVLSAPICFLLILQ